MKPIITEILNIAVKAPSGDNTQPWRFVVNKNIIFIHKRSIEGDSNWGNYNLLITHGTLIENINIAANQFGYSTELAFLPDPNDPTLTATITLQADSSIDTNLNESLFKAIKNRVTNRYPYKKQPLTSEEKTTLTSSILHTPNARVVFIEDKKTIRQISDSVVTQIKVFFSNKSLHEDFFTRLRWSKKSSEISSTGLPADTLALDPITILSMRFVLSFWPIMKFLNLFWFSSIIAMIEKWRRYNKSAAYLAFIVPKQEMTPITPLQAGQDVERIWLTASNIDLALQPTSAILLMEHAIMDKSGFPTSSDQNKLINESYLNIHKYCGASTDESVLWLMRVGHSTRVASHSPRKTPEITFIEN